jgi:hypothetical protein
LIHWRSFHIRPNVIVELYGDCVVLDTPRIRDCRIAVFSWAAFLMKAPLEIRSLFLGCHFRFADFFGERDGL